MRTLRSTVSGAGPAGGEAKIEVNHVPRRPTVESLTTLGTSWLVRSKAWSLRRWADILAVAVVAALAGAIGHSAISAVGPGSFYQSLYEPAVQMACGHGFTNFDDAQPQLDAFLATGDDGSYRCPDRAPTADSGQLGYDQAASRYLMTAVSRTWQLTEISWASLVPLFVLLFVSTSVAAYGLLRLLSPPAVAALGASVFAVSPLQFSMLPELRDYSKAPFLLAAFLVTGLLIRSPVSRRRALALAATAGLVTGVGYGFRSDLTLVVPLFLMAVFLFWPGGPFRDWVTRGLALVLFGRDVRRRHVPHP